MKPPGKKVTPACDKTTKTIAIARNPCRSGLNTKLRLLNKAAIYNFIAFKIKIFWDQNKNEASGYSGTKQNIILST